MTAEPAPAVARQSSGGWPLLGARLVLGGTFLWMGAAKVGDPVQFLKLVRAYGLVPASLPWLLNGLAVSLPWIEVVCGTLLLLGVGLRGVGACAALLLAVFSSAILLRALEIHGVEGGAFCAIHFDCGCGTGDEYVCAKLPMNLGLLLLCLLPLRAQHHARWCLRSRLLSGSS